MNWTRSELLSSTSYVVYALISAFIIVLLLMIGTFLCPTEQGREEPLAVRTDGPPNTCIGQTHPDQDTFTQSELESITEGRGSVAFSDHFVVRPVDPFDILMNQVHPEQYSDFKTYSYTHSYYKGRSEWWWESGFIHHSPSGLKRSPLAEKLLAISGVERVRISARAVAIITRQPRPSRVLVGPQVPDTVWDEAIRVIEDTP